MKIISWNIGQMKEPWHLLLDMDADLALLQEASVPPPELAGRLEVDPGPWEIAGPYATPQRWRTAIVRLSDRIKVEWIDTKPVAEAGWRELGVSIPGTLTAAKVTPPEGESFFAISMYSQWRRPHELAGGSWIVSDASAHRVVSDLSAFIGRQYGHRIVAAGDLNILYGHGERGSPYWAARYQTIFDRMEAIGVPFVGPQAPNGRQADPWPKELPRDSKNVPTYYTEKPESATRQLDFVFASRWLADSVKVRALNSVEEWGPSDHCRIEIEVG